MQMQTSLPIPEANVKEPVLGMFTDFREYLKAFYDFKVHQHRNSYGQYSFKTFSASADIKSPNYLKLIIDGERNLSESTARKFARALGLDKEGTDEFLLLVQYGQAMDPLERNRHLKILNEFRMRRRVRSGEVDTQKIDNVPKWVSYVLNALADQKGADFSIDGLKDLLMNKVSVEDIRRSLQQLFDNHSLELDPESGKVKKGITIPSQDEIPAEIVRKIQAELMYLGMEALLNGRSEEREIGTLTVCLSEPEFEKLKFELRHLRKRVLKDALMARDVSKGDRVYQLNVQLFPITKKSPQIR